jgi:hypothetical protein
VLLAGRGLARSRSRDAIQNAHLDRALGVDDGLSTDETLSGVHGNSADSVLAEMLCDLQDEAVLGSLDLESRKHWRQLTLELHIDDSADDLRDLSGGGSGGRGGETTRGSGENLV